MAPIEIRLNSIDEPGYMDSDLLFKSGVKMDEEKARFVIVIDLYVPKDVEVEYFIEEILTKHSFLIGYLYFHEFINLIQRSYKKKDSMIEILKKHIPDISLQKAETLYEIANEFYINSHLSMFDNVMNFKGTLAKYNNFMSSRNMSTMNTVIADVIVVMVNNFKFTEFGDFVKFNYNYRDFIFPGNIIEDSSNAPNMKPKKESDSNDSGDDKKSSSDGNGEDDNQQSESDTGNNDNNNDQGDNNSPNNSSQPTSNESKMNTLVDGLIMKLRGSGFEEMFNELGIVLKVEMDWAERLIHMVNNETNASVNRNKVSWTRPNVFTRSYATLPTLIVNQNKPYLYIVYDSSGSMSDQVLRKMNYILKYFHENKFNFTVIVHTDKAVREDFKYNDEKKINEFIRARRYTGGTSHVDAFNMIEKGFKGIKEMKSSIIIVLSDMESDLHSIWNDYTFLKYSKTIGITDSRNSNHVKDKFDYFIDILS